MVRILKDNFVLVTIDGRKERRRQDEVGEFIRATRCVSFTASGRTCAVTSRGKVLGNVGGISEKHRLNSLAKILEAWKELPDSERKPGTVKIDESAPIDAKLSPQGPPPGTLVVRTYNRQLEFDAGKALRYTRPEDYPEKDQRSAARFREAGHDFIWIPEREWRAFIPADPKTGDSFPAPLSFTLRVFRYHLDPERGLGEGITFRGANATSGKLTFTVENVSPERIELRLNGFARLSHRRGAKSTSYSPSLLGYLTYDRRTKTVSRFEVVAFGNVHNTPRTVRPGDHPLGIAYELVRTPTPAERVVPRGGRDNVERYLMSR